MSYLLNEDVSAVCTSQGNAMYERSNKKTIALNAISTPRILGMKDNLSSWGGKHTIVSKRD